jgi:hypothetical protein
MLPINYTTSNRDRRKKKSAKYKPLVSLTEFLDKNASSHKNKSRLRKIPDLIQAM